MSALAWLCYTLLLGTLLSAAALAAEAALRAGRRGGRWAWLAAMAASVALPAWAYLRPPGEPLAPDAFMAPVLELAPVVMLPVSTAAETSVDWARWAVLGWVAASALALAVLLLSHRALSRSRRGWREHRVDGTAVLVSRDLGPAVVGVLHPRIVVPEWLLALDAALRRLMLLHEEEHRAAGDSRVLFAALLLCAAMPWQPLLWWQLHRLRVAMELDCDERVLARAGDPARYGQLLLEVGRRRSERSLLAAAFAEPRMLLERRVRALLQWPRARRPVAALAMGGAALLLLGFAYATPDPLARAAQPVPSAEKIVQAVVDRVTGDEAEATSPPDVPVVNEAAVRPMVQDTPPPKPVFTPMTVRPTMKNGSEVAQALVQHYPPVLRDAGVGGEAMVWVYVDETGRIVKSQLGKSTGVTALDEAALKVAAVAQFTPAENRGRPVAVWVQVPVRFAAQGRDSTAAAPKPAVISSSVEADEHGASAFVETHSGPGYQDRKLLNAREVARAALGNYPPLLRDAGISGTTVIGVFANPEGLATKTQVMQSSGHQALDEAALKVVELMKFEAAAEAGWVQVSVWLRDVTAGPAFTPMTVRPELRNASEVQRALIDNYPKELRDQGISTQPIVWFLIDVEGRVAQARLSKSGGFPAADSAAVRVARLMRFTPAENRGQVVPVWIEIPIRFTAR